ncbi:hybrid sensor histidine kinase/response regulator [Flavobacterium sufflavum]|uniref:histidine kinase n=1 Tax=Flavobacterium sufflavum TaxID=1921138 RepID=A0A3S2U532_9FLAO|nr:hybrid sensor histidine kinase/response regulator transcription factor [Flavobacterium sufflavum]RVT78371.1 hybrid sensor histidine kinase/response regulator [Flavobacterium sufflavum]
MKNQQVWSYVVSFFVVSLLSLSGLKAQNLFFEKISGREANPVTQIHGIAKDSIGYIWFGSWNGAYRYDGKTFDFFYHNPKDKTSLPNNRIRNIVSDKKLGLWFFTFDRKYVRFNYQLNSFKIVLDNKVPKIVIERLNNKSSELNKNRIVNGKSYYLSSHQFTSQDVKSGEEYRYTANINHPGQLLDDYITDFFIDDENIIWLGSRGGDVYKANPNRNPFELHYSYRKDSENTKLATVKGILKVDDKIWLATDEGILIYNNKGLDYNHPFYKSNSQIKNARSFLKDNKGRIWIGGINGLECYDPKTNQCKVVINRVLSPNLEIWSVYALEVSGNNLWVGLYNGIACINLANDKISYYDLAATVHNGSVMDVLSVNGRELWLATEGSGVIRLKIDNKGKIYDKLALNTFDKHLKNKISGNIIYALHRDKRGAIWVGSSEGLNKIYTNTNPMRIEKIQLQSESPNIYISSITDDAKGNLWIAHKQGLSMIDIRTNKISNYRREDQFGSWTFSERAFYKDLANQKIYFGDKNGYLSFSPKEIKTNSVNDKLIFKTLYLSNEKVIPMDTINDQIVLTKDLSQTQSIQLDYENRSFTIELASFNYSNTNKMVYEYTLEGYEDKWIKTNSSKITYNKLPPGNYVFKARVVSPNDTKSPIKVLDIDVSAPWYGTWWAKLFFLGLLAAIAFWIFKAMLYRDRLKNEIKLERLNTERQEALNKEKIEFFTNISHDLKTPLTLIVDPLKRIHDNKVAAEDKEVYFSIVNRNINYLTKLIHQILDFRKSEMGKLKLNPTVQNFNLFIEECYTSFQFIAAKRNIALQLQVDKTPLYCSLDFEKVQQIIVNIVSNAFQYTSDGGLVILSAALNEAKSTLEITVQDNGVGINAAELEKIFEPFNNVGSSPYHGYSSGIGLSLTRNLIELLKGTISIESEPDKGTKVLISLPYDAAKTEDITLVKVEQLHQKEEDYEDNQEKESEQISFESAKPTLLIVEDNPDVQTYLNKELGKEYTLIQEYDGKKGLEAAIKYIPDIIVSDIMMPEMQGTEFCAALKGNENTSHIPLIFLTAKGSDENQIEGYNLGAEAYVMKPFNVDVLNAQIKSVLENRIILQNRLAGIKKIEQLQQEVPDQDNEFLEKVIEKITLNIEETDFNSEELAQALGISQRQLYRKLKGITGNTVHEFITKVKMNQAEELLRNSDLSISQIAYKVGFSEPSNFSRTFSKHFGCSPSQYLK